MFARQGILMQSRTRDPAFSVRCNMIFRCPGAHGVPATRGTTARGPHLAGALPARQGDRGRFADNYPSLQWVREQPALAGVTRNYWPVPEPVPVMFDAPAVDEPPGVMPGPAEPACPAPPPGPVPAWLFPA